MTDDASMDFLAERTLAVDLFNHVWTLLDTPDRTPQQDAEMLDAALASRQHWERPGGAEQWAIGEWQISRVYAVLGDGPLALAHARQCWELSVRDGVDDFVEASAHEAIARALAVCGDMDGARAERDLAYALAVALDDDDDRAVVESDLSTLPIAD